MKKSTRILSILMAFAMLIGSFSVMGSAYQAYKGDAIAGQYNDVDAPEFTTEQYASMALDEVDRMLAKEQMILNVYIGTLNLGSINTAITSLFSLVASVETLLPLLGSAASLPDYITPLEGIQRFEETDTEVIYAVFDTLASLSPIVESYVNGSISLGIMNSFIADFIFDVRSLALGILYGMSKEGKAADYDAMDDGKDGLPEKYQDEENGAQTLLQDLINELVLGEWKLLDDEFDDPYSYVMYDSYSFAEEYGETQPDIDTYDYYGWVHPNQWVTVGLGGCERVAAGTTVVPPAEYTIVDITTDRNGYEFIEDLMQRAYNYILIPVLERDTVRALRKLCGIEYLDKYTKRTIYNEETGTWDPNPDYDPYYKGEVDSFDPATDATEYYYVFNIDATVEKEFIPEGQTLVDNFNDILGRFIDRVLVAGEDEKNENGYSWTWVYASEAEEGKTGNSYLFQNICSVARFVLQITGDLFFSERVNVPTAAGFGAMTDQQLVAFVMRAILNSSVEWMYVEDEYQSIVDVGYRAVEQLAWQDIPQITYTKPARSAYGTDNEYYAAVVDKMLDILFDVAVYNLNQGFDMVPASGNDPVNGAGLIPYQEDGGSYENTLVQVVAWAVNEYGALLNLDFFCDDANGATTGLTADMAWQDIDTLVDAIIPIKGSDSWIASEISNSGIVSKAFIFDFILKPLYTLDATNFATIFKRNTGGAFASKDGIEIIIDLLTGIFELLFPGVFQPKTSIDQILDNTTLGQMVGDLVKALSTKNSTNALGQTLEGQGADIVEVGLPLICLLLGLSDDQEFEEIEIYLPETIATTGAAPSFDIYNGSSGINTGYTDKDGNFTQDQLYTYEIVNAFVNTYDANGNSTEALSQTGITVGQTLAGGDRINVTLNGTRTAGSLVEFIVQYKVMGESGEEMTSSTLSKTVYAYVGNVDKDDDATEAEIVVDGRKIQYNPSIYLASGDSLSDVEGYTIRIKDDKSGSAAAASIGNVAINSTTYPFIEKNAGSESKPVSANMEGKEGLYFLSPFAVAKKDADSYYERYEEEYQVDEETGELVLDTNGDPIPVSNNGGVEDGEYIVTTDVTVAGTTKTVTTYVHLYNDFGLESLFNRAVTANRQDSNYDKSNTVKFAKAWADYSTALTNAARFVLNPKVGSEFDDYIKATAGSGYENKYEELATALEDSIEALEEFALNAGVDGIKSELAKYSGINYTIKYDSNGYPYKEELEYDDPAYKYFGMRDYVPHTYTAYRDARERSEDLINSQQFFVPAPFEDGYEPSDEEALAYNEAVEAYLKNVEEMGVISSIDETYANHMVDLTGKRLIRLYAGEEGVSKLELVYGLYSNETTAGMGYTATSVENYNRAVAFAAGVLEENPDEVLPSKVNRATSELVYAWKSLVKGADFTKLDEALAQTRDTFEETGEDYATQTTYTVDSYKAFVEYYIEARDIDRDLSEGSNDYINELAEDLLEAYNALEPATSTEASFEFSTVDNEYFWDHDFGITFIPQVSQGAITHESYGSVLPSDGETAIDGFMVGYGVTVEESNVLSVFSELNNVNAEVTLNDADMYGTGSIIQLKNAATDEILATYMIIIIGDINGDLSYDATDKALLKDNMEGVTDWEWSGTYEEYKAAAADLNNDGGIDAGDISVYTDIIDSGAGTLNQVPPADWSTSYIAY